jgi:hypothetical protein
VTAQQCACGCGRPVTDGYVAEACAARAAGHLAEIIDMTPAARLVAAGLVRRGGTGGGGKPGSRPPLNDGATDALNAVQNALTTLARDIAETRGAQIVSAGFEGHRVADPMVEAATWLTGQLGWLRHAVDDQGTSWAAWAFAEIATNARRIRGLVDGPAARKYLGPCGAVETPEECTRYGIGGHDCDQHQTCDGDVYGYRGGTTGTCRTCGRCVDQAERTAWLDAEVRQHAFRAAHIADAYGLRVKTIRSWADRGHLREHGRDRDDRPLYLVGDVLDLAVEAAARRADSEARRARHVAVA